MTDDVVYNSKPLQFALKGAVAVYYLDGEIVEGVFATQDAYNIFITVDNEPVMIPRQQIRYIKGLAGQGIEPDTSLATPSDDAPTQVPTPFPPKIVVTQPLPDAPDITASPSTPIPTPPPLPHSVDKEDEGHEEDGTMILAPDLEEAVYDIGDDDEDDGTMILNLNDERAAAAFDSPYETSQSMTGAVPPASVEEEEEFDMTVVLGDAALPDELGPETDADEKTVALGLDDNKELTAMLICTNGPHVGEVFPLSAGITTVGRSSDNVIVLFKDKEISRHHAIVLFESDRFVVQDQNSLNGTFVNDEQISGPRYLENGDVILVGVSYLKYEMS